jgi:hypothetical protein
VKVSSLIPTVLLAFSLASPFAGAAQAQPAAPQKPAATNVASATIILAHCEAGDPLPCGINSAPAAKASDADANILPTTANSKTAANEPATPVPEPQTFIMMMLGLVVLGFASRRGGSEKFIE